MNFMYSCLLSYLYNVPSYHPSVRFWFQKWDPFVLNGSSDADPGGHYCKTKYAAYADYASNYKCVNYFLFMNSTGYQKGLEDDDPGKRKPRQWPEEQGYQRFGTPDYSHQKKVTYYTPTENYHP